MQNRNAEIRNLAPPENCKSLSACGFRNEIAGLTFHFAIDCRIRSEINKSMLANIFENHHGLEERDAEPRHFRVLKRQRFRENT